jgi:hypothetical protein
MSSGGNASIVIFGEAMLAVSFGHRNGFDDDHE